ncbi:MAG: ribonuclease Z [Candidatus Omnitrophota bacterium]|nr:ribonuclease Z [Candidatus Omnitrophota bacterium]MBU1894758.1 ribonuclease Z [Candidatus Omnitrophota bacterium]
MSKFKITILGTTAAVPTAQRAHSSLHISYKDEQESCFLFDCGEGTQRQLITARVSMMKIDNIFITHWHGDHCLGLPGLIDTMGFEGREEPLTIYAPEVKKVKRLLSFCHSAGKFKINLRKVPIKGKKPVKIFKTERFEISSIPVKHGMPAVAYAVIEHDKVSIDTEKIEKLNLPQNDKLYKKLKAKGKVRIKGVLVKLEDVSLKKKGKKIVYSGDTEICDNLISLVENADLLVQDCTYFDTQGTGKPYKHASLPEIMEMSCNKHVKRTVLTHISRKYHDVAWLKNLIKNYPGFDIAEDFMEISVT